MNSSDTEGEGDESDDGGDDGCGDWGDDNGDQHFRRLGLSRAPSRRPVVLGT